MHKNEVVESVRKFAIPCVKPNELARLVLLLEFSFFDITATGSDVNINIALYTTTTLREATLPQLLSYFCRAVGIG